MADGQFRFQPGAGQYYYSQANQQAQPNRPIHLRTGSPPNTSRIGFNNDTPSPSRSPGRHSPPSSSYGMYGQTHQQAQNVLANGHQRFGIGLNVPKQYQAPNSHHTNHSSHHQQQEHTNHNGHNSNFGSHQHTSSASGFSSGATHFQSNHMRNGTPNSLQNGLNKPPNEHWAQQLAIAHSVREATATHSHARNTQNNTRTISTAGPEFTRRDGEHDDQVRTITSLQNTRQEWAELDCSGQGLRAVAPQLFEYRFLDRLYLNNNNLTYIPGSIGLLRHLTHLDLSTNQLQALPAELGMLVYLKSLYLVDNRLEFLPNELGALYQLDMLAIEGNPLVSSFKEMIQLHGTRNLITQLREQAEIPSPPSERPWIVIDEVEAERPSSEKLLVMSYNTLCDRAATQTAYGYTPMGALSWEYRKEVILDEVRGRNADICCLQEVDSESYHEYFRPSLAINGYKGIFWPKPRARTMFDKEAGRVDGCATFYKDAKFILLDKQLIDFANTAINRPDMKKEHDIFNRVMPKDNIAVMTFLENRQSGERLMVANAHLTWPSDYKDVKLVQAAILMEQISKIADSYTKIAPCENKSMFRFTDGDSDAEKGPEVPAPETLPSMTYNLGEEIPLILCVDANSTPDSGVYELFAQGSIPASHPDFGNYKYGNFTRDGITHPFKLRSSYSHVDELSFTNYTPGFSGVIDYIWYSIKSQQVTGLLGEVDQDYLQRVPGFPNYHFPSDHLALNAEYVLKASVAALSRREKDRATLADADFGQPR